MAMVANPVVSRGRTLPSVSSSSPPTLQFSDARPSAAFSNILCKGEGLRLNLSGLKLRSVSRNASVKTNLRNNVNVRCAVAVKENYGVKVVQGTGRKVLEDTTLCVSNVTEKNNKNNKFSFYGVFDGHGGTAVAQFLKKEFWNVYEKNLACGDYIRATNLTYEELDKETIAPPKGWFGAMRERGMGGSKCGSTAATVLLIEGENPKLLAANVGDAKIILSKNKQAIQLTVDHKPDILAERLRIEAKNPFPKNPLVRNIDGIWRVGGLLALSRAFGDVYLKNWSDGRIDGASGGFGLTAEPSILFENITPEDEWVILGSDGLWDYLPSQDAVDMCNAAGDDADPQELTSKLIQTALASGSTDDISIIVVKLPKLA